METLKNSVMLFFAGVTLFVVFTATYEPRVQLASSTVHAIEPKHDLEALNAAAETDREKILHRGLLSFKRPVRACWSEGCEMFPAEGREWIVLDFKDAPEGRAWCISSGFITSPTPKCAWTAPLPAVNYNIRVLEKGCHLRNSC